METAKDTFKRKAPIIIMASIGAVFLQYQQLLVVSPSPSYRFLAVVRISYRNPQHGSVLALFSRTTGKTYIVTNAN